MHHTYKGIYMKFRSEGGTVSNILYEKQDYKYRNIINHHLFYSNNILNYVDLLHLLKACLYSI